MIDVTTFYGYKTQFSFYVENNGANPITVNSIDLLNQSYLENQNIFHEIFNSLPISITGNNELDVICNYYSLNYSDFSSDLTYSIEYSIVDLSDFTTVIDNTSIDITFSFSNLSVSDITNYPYIEDLNKSYLIGPTNEDTTILITEFTSTGYPAITFDNKLKFLLFINKYQPQFAVFNNISTPSNMIVGNFYYNTDENSIECYFTDEEKTSLVGYVFNNLFLFYSNL